MTTLGIAFVLFLFFVLFMFALPILVWVIKIGIFCALIVGAALIIRKIFVR